VAHTRAITGEFKGLHDSAGGISTAHHRRYGKIGTLVDSVTGETAPFSARTPFEIFDSISIVNR